MDNKNLINIQKKLIKILEKKKKLKLNNFKKKIEYRFLENKHLDSLEIINFLINVEDQFKVVFTNKETESDKFRTLKGISEIVIKKKTKI